MQVRWLNGQGLVFYRMGEVSWRGFVGSSGIGYYWLIMFRGSLRQFRIRLLVFFKGFQCVVIMKNLLGRKVGYSLEVRCLRYSLCYKFRQQLIQQQVVMGGVGIGVGIYFIGYDVVYKVFCFFRGLVGLLEVVQLILRR